MRLESILKEEGPSFLWEQLLEVYKFIEILRKEKTEQIFFLKLSIPINL